MKYLQNDEQMNFIGPLPLNSNKINPSFFTIFIDGGLRHELPQKPKQSLSLGDKDSTSMPLDIVYPQQKDLSDYALALNHIPPGITRIHCYGLFGKRLDHQLCILGETLHFIQDNSIRFDFYHLAHVCMCILPAGRWSFVEDCEFSLLSHFHQRIKLTGDIKYPLDKEYTYNIPYTSRTLSNMAFGKFILINEWPLTIYFNHDKE